MADSKTFGFLKGNLAGIPDLKSISRVPDVSRRDRNAFGTGPLTGTAPIPAPSGKKGVAAATN